jgi:hypothetical protein
MTLRIVTADLAVPEGPGVRGRGTPAPDAVHAALAAEVARLRELVEDAYTEGYTHGFYISGCWAESATLARLGPAPATLRTK